MSVLTIKEELIIYCNNCLNDIYVSEFEDYISCLKHKKACKRLLNDFDRENTYDFPYVWNEEEAEKIVKWFTYLRHSKGALARKPIELTVWQKFFLCQIYGWRHADTGYKRFTMSFIECARKQAKSQMEAGVILYEMATQSMKNGEIYECYTAGTKKDQSMLIVEECKNMLRGSPLKAKFKINKTSIEHIKSGSFLKPLNKEDKKSGDGTNIAVLVLDEYHQHETTEYYDLFQGAGTKEALLMIITTAGVNLNCPCYTQEYTYCSNLLNGDDVVNDNYFTDILEIDDGDDPEEIRNWWKANPIRMSYAEGRKKLMDNFKVAKDIPEKMISFLQKSLDQWQSNNGANSYMNIDKFKECMVKQPPIDLKGRDVFIGVDISAKLDLTSVCFMFPYERNGILHQYFESYSFVPNEESIKFHQKVDKMPFETWVKQNYIKITNSPIVDQKVIIDFCKNKIKEYGIKNVTFGVDPANASLFTTTLIDDGYDVFEIYFSYKHQNEPCTALREQIYEGRIKYLYNPCLEWQMTNAKVVQNNEGYIKIDKSSSKERIDAIDALICSMKLSMYWKPKVDLNAIILSDDFVM